MLRKVFSILKERFVHLRPYQFAVGIITIILLLIIGILTIILQVGQKTLPEQLAAMRWSQDKDCAQLSCFYSTQAYVTEEEIDHLRYNLEQKLKEQAIEPNTENARLYLDAYSARGQISVQSDKKSIEVDAIGVGGDFFYFHPLTMLSGMYFSGDALMQDSVILDEEAAWQLFGSNDIEGQIVTIAGQQYRVAGVFERAQGDLETMAGNKDTTIYMFYPELEKIAACSITCYEVVMPNPVKGFAFKVLSEAGVTDETMVKIVENSQRVSYESFYNIWKNRAARSMKTDDIVYPFWENLARVKEETLMEIAFWQCILSVIVIVYWGVAFMIFVIRHKPSGKDLVRAWEWCCEKIRLRLQQIKQERIRKKNT